MKKPHQGGEPVRGCNIISTVSHETLNNKLPLAVINKLEEEMRDINFGGVSLIIAFRDGLPTFRIEKTISMMTATKGIGQ